MKDLEGGGCSFTLADALDPPLVLSIADDLWYMHDVQVRNDKCGMVDQVSTGYTKQICQAATFLKNFKICSGRLFRRSGPSWMIPGQCTQKLVGHPV